jgi:hypothetical protein
MTTQTISMAPYVVAHHEAGHAVANLVLGIPFKAVRIIPGPDGKIGVPFKTNPWLGPRPESNPGEFTDAEWAELSQDVEKWEAWKKKDNDGYAIVLLAGKPAQFKYSGPVKDEEVKADYSIVENALPRCHNRLEELEQAARELINNHWPAVLAIAAELLVRQELTPKEAEEIFRRSMPLVQLPKPKH